MRKKLRMRSFFDVSKVKESSFLKSDLTDPPQIFDARLLENTNLSPPELKPLKKFCFDREVRKKMVSFKFHIIRYFHDESQLLVKEASD